MYNSSCFLKKKFCVLFVLFENFSCGGSGCSPICCFPPPLDAMVKEKKNGHWGNGMTSWFFPDGDATVLPIAITYVPALPPPWFPTGPGNPMRGGGPVNRPGMGKQWAGYELRWWVNELKLKQFTFPNMVLAKLGTPPL